MNTANSIQIKLASSEIQRMEARLAIARAISVFGLKLEETDPEIILGEVCKAILEATDHELCFPARLLEEDPLNPAIPESRVYPPASVSDPFPQAPEPQFSPEHSDRYEARIYRKANPGLDSVEEIPEITDATSLTEQIGNLVARVKPYL